MNKLPIKIDIHEFLVKLAVINSMGKRKNLLANLTLVAFYYLLQVGEYTCKRNCNESK